MTKKILLIGLLSTMFLLSGCTSIFGTNLIRTNYQAADNLLEKSHLQKGTTIIIATIVDVNNVEKSSQLGRTISEQLATQFVNNGIKVIEIKLRNNIYIKNQTGELVLSRKIGKLAKEIKADSIIAGTYSNSRETVFVNLRVINPKTNIIQSIIDYEIPKDDDIQQLIDGKRNFFL